MISCDIVEVQDMEGEDLPDVLAIENRSFASPWSRKTFEDTLVYPLARNYVLKGPSKKTIGYASFYVVQHEAHMLNIAIHPDCRKKGLATTFLNHMIQRLHEEGVTEFYLEVREGNTDAIKLYRRFRFEFIGKRRKYYTETNEDALVMRLQIQQN